MKERKLVLDYGIGSVEYIKVKEFKIIYPKLILDGIEIDIKDVKFIKRKDFITWKNIRKR